MRQFGLLGFVTISGLFMLTPLLADTPTVEGVYRSNLFEYSKDGKKKKQLTPPVTDEQIKGTKVIERTSRGLVRVKFRGEDIWLRESALKLSVPFKPVCPDDAPGRAADRTTPTSSAMGALCR